MANIDEKEFNETENESGLVTIKLKKPLIYNGENIDTLTFKFDTLTGGDGMNIDAEMQANGKVAVIPAGNTEFIALMAVRACTKNIGRDIYSMMDIRDYIRITNEGRSFLLA